MGQSRGLGAGAGRQSQHVSDRGRVDPCSWSADRRHRKSRRRGGACARRGDRRGDTRSSLEQVCPHSTQIRRCLVCGFERQHPLDQRRAVGRGEWRRLRGPPRQWPASMRETRGCAAEQIVLALRPIARLGVGMPKTRGILAKLTEVKPQRQQHQQHREQAVGGAGSLCSAPASAGSCRAAGGPGRQARRARSARTRSCRKDPSTPIAQERLSPWADRPSRSPTDQPDHQNCRHPGQDDGGRAVAGRAHLITTPHGKLPTVMSLSVTSFRCRSR